ncbi:TIGR00282 family metallophosphoesterase, partial [Roseiarcus sp.]|uniref:TIGR00282 family metallophosphoesterase n=1 Tax=Roseiarcus sp. TaxID=1969460 RepID=UPI003C5CA604
MRLLFIGDVVGRSGRAAITQQVPLLRERWSLDFVVVNGENAAGGFGVTESIVEEFLAVGVDAVTLGNHAFDQREALMFIERQPRLIRPANYPAGTPGRGSSIVENARGARLLVINLLGRIFMDALDDPFATLERELAASPLGQASDAVVIDVHAEATSEKSALALFADGRASLVVGTHTHVPSA